MKTRHPLILGAFLLTCSSLICRLLGFVYRIFLSRTIGASGMGLYQLIAPFFTLCFCISASGIATAMTRQIAAQFALHKPVQAHYLLRVGLLVTTLPALFLALLLEWSAPWIAENLLGEPSCAALLRLLSLALPFATAHACMNSYYYAQKSTFIPAIGQILEQIIRIVSAYGCYCYLVYRHLPVTPMIAVAGAALSECMSLLFSALCLRFEKKKQKKPAPGDVPERFLLKNLLLLAYPITLNRLSLNLLHSLEAILLPACLRSFGMSREGALASFGTLSGMALPVLLFPTALINSVSTLLMPSVAESEATGDTTRTRQLIRRTGLYSLCFGMLFFVFFFFLGIPLGSWIFKNQESGVFIRTLAFLSPFLYLNITIASILNGLGKTLTNFRINFTSLVIRIACILFLVPLIGMRGYLYGLLSSEIFATIAGVYILKNIKS